MRIMPRQGYREIEIRGLGGEREAAAGGEAVTRFCGRLLSSDAGEFSF